MEHDNSLGGAFNKETGELNTDKLREHFKNLKDIKESKMNILLMGYTGSGKSSLINALFGEEITKTGVGESITQHIEKHIDEKKGLVFWDTQGIEAADYHDTMQGIKQRMEEVSPSKGHDEKEAEEKIVHMAYLCILESYPRIEKRERAIKIH
ncbi:50S ribosome-binding GTPase [Helicobacter pylori]|uniref:GTPase n=1 Tax=Helicobacter pylori TaxID=210 RepID=UPI001ABA261B|nr:GTPase [Helicobacter pylori]MDO7811378.1 GTPase [Helicobacter pylori]WQU18336.1 50S ribosome-binding GTPase [Helicobacter pylori]WQU26810.1 50S ribosome-binding GTPase [Helicobacter pylori]